MKTAPAMIHTFERAGLGVAPFHFDGYEFKTYQACHGAPVQVGGSCDFCGTGIKNTYWVKSADGRRFKVGSECINKTGDKGLRRDMRCAKNQHERELRWAREARKAAKDKLRIWTAWARIDEVSDALTAEPHPRGFTDRETGRALTLLDWAEWMIENAGTAGRLQVAKEIEKAIAA